MSGETTQVQEGSEENGVPAAEQKLCRAVHNGRIALQCELDPDHTEDGSWHKATYHDHQEVTYLGSHHVVDVYEVVTWEPRDHVREAVGRIVKKGRADG